MSGGPLEQCQNCGHRLRPWDKFCSQCGQDTLDHPPSLWEFVHEFLLHYVAFEGKLWKSLWGLLARPGFLTIEYLAGRKQRYVLPLRLILTLGLAFFLSLKLLPEQEMVRYDERPRASAAAAASAVSSAPAHEPPDPVGQAASDLRREGVTRAGHTDFERLLRVTPKALHGALERSKARFERDEPAEWRRIGQQMLSQAPYAVLASLPFYAGLLALVYWRRRLNYGAHFVFAMHLHAAWYGVLLLGQLPGSLFTLAAFLWGNAYPVLALKRVYGGGWLATVLRAAVLLVLHGMLLLLGLLLLALAGALSG